MSGIGSHTKPNNGATNSWITPKEIIDELGPFDLDPCQCVPQPWKCAYKSFTKTEDGLSKEWFGRVWLNPPYGKETGKWLAKMAEHRCGIALTFARTETQMFHKYVWNRAIGFLFLEKRLHFHYPDGKRAKGNAGGPSILIAYSDSDLDRLKNCKIPGYLVEDCERTKFKEKYRPQ